MNIQKCNHATRCDIYGCKNLAGFSVGKDEYCGSKQIHLCSLCMKDLYESIGKILVPKPIENPLKKPRKIKEK